MGAVAVVVAGVAVVVDEVVLVDDGVGHAVAVAVGAEERVAEVDARVEDGDG